MIRVEPRIKVGICEGYEHLTIRLNGPFVLEGLPLSGLLRLRSVDGRIMVQDERDRESFYGSRIIGQATPGSTFSIVDVAIGVNFHWERRQEERFGGNLELLACTGDKIAVINDIALEEYLVSVIASEMSASAPLEFLKAHAIISRSWLAALLERKGKMPFPGQQSIALEGEIIRWYGREDHDNFDVCADDHCQRYQGLPVNSGGKPREAVQATRGLFLVQGADICDARYHKACGGRTEDFATAWEDEKVPYLTSVSDGLTYYPPVRTEEEAVQWVLSRPQAYCNNNDTGILREILPSFDQETVEFFRWQVEYPRRELETIILEKTGRDLGAIYDLVALQRGPSGRICRLQILGQKASLIVGKELEIRRVLSRSHLLSSAFIVRSERDAAGLPLRFIIHGGGWGHGVGLCQIGAALMAARGVPATEILEHYFYGATLQKLY